MTWITAAYFCMILPFLVSSTKAASTNSSVINLSVVACGDRVPETLVLLKSALMFTKNELHFYIFTEPNLKSAFIDQFKKWPEFVQRKFNYSLMDTTFPSQNYDEWRKLFRLCASQRLFLPEILKSVDSLLYVDTDVLFLTDLNEIWRHFYLFNQSHLAALAPEHEDANIGWYNRFARHPYYGPLGLNSGVMLMNLTRMREFNFVSKFFPLYTEYKYNISWGDQCLLNILFHFHPDKLYVYDCTYNYRPDHCMYGSNCRPADSEGARVLHGCRRVFHNEKEPAFRAVYSVFDQYDFEEKNIDSLYKKLKDQFETIEVSNTYCGKAKNIFLKTIEQQLIYHKSIMKDAKLKYDQQLQEAKIASLNEEQSLKFHLNDEF